MTAAAAERGPILQEIRTAARHLVVYGAGNMAARALGFLMIPFYTHYLSPKDYGILEILDQSMASLLRWGSCLCGRSPHYCSALKYRRLMCCSPWVRSF
jgi:hypothetical protein